jgi:hypothetical protein
MNAQITIYDPRLGQEFEITNLLTQKRFSNLLGGFFVITGVGIDWDARVALLQEAISKTSNLGFASVTPWIPYTKSLISALKAFPISHEFEKSLIVYSDPSAEAIEKILHLRRTHGLEASGEWCIGGCFEEFVSPERVSVFRSGSWDFAHILSQSDRIGCALELAEMKQSTFITRVFSDFDQWLTRMQLACSLEHKRHDR